MENIIAVVVLLIIVGVAARYVAKAKKNGQKCIGCPNGCSCSKAGPGVGCACRLEKEDEK